MALRGVQQFCKIRSTQASPLGPQERGVSGLPVFPFQRAYRRDNIHR